MKFSRGWLCAVVLGACLSGNSALAAVINFDDGYKSGGSYFEAGFVFEQVANGAVSTPRGCVEASINSNCLLLPNQNSDKVVKMSLATGGIFSLLGFTFDGRDGEGPALYVSRYLTGGTLFSEPDTGNTMNPSGLLSQFMDVTSLFFRDAGTGSSRVDNLNVSLAPVPVPAAGLLLIAGLGALAAVGRRKS